MDFTEAILLATTTSSYLQQAPSHHTMHAQRPRGSTQSDHSFPIDLRAMRAPTAPGRISVEREYSVESHYEDVTPSSHYNNTRNLPYTTTHITAYSTFPSPPPTPEARRPSTAASIKSFFSRKKSVGKLGRRRRRSSSPMPPPIPTLDSESISPRKSSAPPNREKKLKSELVEDKKTTRRWKLLQGLDRWRFPTEWPTSVPFDEEESEYRALGAPPMPILMDSGNLLGLNSMTNENRDRMVSRRSSLRSASVYSQDGVSPTMSTIDNFGTTSGVTYSCVRHSRLSDRITDARRRSRSMAVSVAGQNDVVFDDRARRSFGNDQYSPTAVYFSLRALRDSGFESDTDDKDEFNNTETSRRTLRRSTTRWSSNETCPFRRPENRLSSATVKAAEHNSKPSPIEHSSTYTSIATQTFMNAEIGPGDLTDTDDSRDDRSFRTCYSFQYRDVETADDMMSNSLWRVPSSRHSALSVGSSKRKPSLWKKLGKTINQTSSRVDSH